MKKFESQTDQELIQLYLKGGTEAMGTIVLRYKDKIYTAINLMVKDRSLAEDIFQDVFVCIIDALKRGLYNDEQKFSAWAMRIAHNLCINHFRKVKRFHTVETDGNMDIFKGEKYSESGADHKMIMTQDQERVRKMIGQLSYEQQEVIILRNYSDMSFKEIADFTHCSVNTALGRMRYALINLRRMKTEKEMES